MCVVRVCNRPRMSVEVSICVGVSGSLTCRVSLCLYRSALPSPPPPSVYTCTHTHTLIRRLHSHHFCREKKRRETEREREGGYLLWEKTSRATEGATSRGSQGRSRWIICWTPRVRDLRDSWGADQTRPCLQDIRKTAPTPKDKTWMKRPPRTSEGSHESNCGSSTTSQQNAPAVTVERDGDREA